MGEKRQWGENSGACTRACSVENRLDAGGGCAYSLGTHRDESRCCTHECVRHEGVGILALGVGVLAFGLAGVLWGAVVIDRVAVIVGKHVIKTSDIERDLRVTNFLNHEPLRFDPDAKRKAAERLIDQQIIRDEMATGGYRRPTDADVDALLQKIPHDPATLARYGLTEDQLREQLLWQLTVIRFIDQRFRPAVLVTDEEVQAYYKEHFTGKGSFEELAPKIRATLEGEQINKEFESWIEQARKRTHIEYRQEAFA